MVLAASHHSHAGASTTSMLHQLTASRSMSIRRLRALWSSSTLLRCAAKRVRTASGCGEAAAELRACARGDVWSSRRVASPNFPNTARRRDSPCNEIAPCDWNYCARRSGIWTWGGSCCCSCSRPSSSALTGFARARVSLLCRECMCHHTAQARHPRHHSGATPGRSDAGHER